MNDDVQQKPQVSEFDLMLQSVLATEEGRAVLWWVMSEAGTFSENLWADSHMRDICEGKRAVGLAVFKRLTPAIFHQMQDEYQFKRGKENDRSN